MNKSDSIKELATALAKAQGEMPAAKMNAENPFLKSKYADLGSIIEAAKPVLAKHDLSISQLTTGDGESIGVTTILMHASGEWIESTVALSLDDEKGKSQAQVAGSIISYLRRYSLASIIGMYSDEDNDGTAKQDQHKPAQRPQVQSAQKPPNGNGTPAPKALMTMEMAEAVVDKDGVKYINLDSKKLSDMSTGIASALKKPDLTEERRTDLEYKRDAIAVILQERAKQDA